MNVRCVWLTPTDYALVRQTLVDERANLNSETALSFVHRGTSFRSEPWMPPKHYAYELEDGTVKLFCYDNRETIIHE